ncbi:hypothetical protein SDJN03_28424, partial [Cucurbita argyrosperma subsp. sororia]
MNLVSWYSGVVSNVFLTYSFKSGFMVFECPCSCWITYEHIHRELHKLLHISSRKFSFSIQLDLVFDVRWNVVPIVLQHASFIWSYWVHNTVSC